MSGYPLEAVLIIDNNVLVSLCEFYCDENKSLNFNKLVAKTCEDISSDFYILKRFAHNELIYTTPLVHDEFKPERGIIATFPGYSEEQCCYLKEHVKGEVEVLDIKSGSIDILRNFEHTPRRFGENLTRISNPDLSLAILALGLARKINSRVYVLTDEEDLRFFISWMRTRPEAKRLCPNVHLIESLHSIAYFDSVHRECFFTTEYILQRQNHLLIRHLSREMLKGTSKGQMIAQTMKSQYDSIQKSGEFKRQRAGGIEV